MNQTQTLIQECERRGVTLEPHGDKLWIGPEENTTPELVERIRQRKFEIIGSFEAKQRAAFTHLIAWLVTQGDFDAVGRGARIALMNEMNRCEHPLCLRAYTRLHLEDLRKVP